MEYWFNYQHWCCYRRCFGLVATIRQGGGGMGGGWITIFRISWWPQLFYSQLLIWLNRTEWSPLWSVIIWVINIIRRPHSGSLICLITSMITDLILLHEKFLQFDWLRAVVFQLNLKYLHVNRVRSVPHFCSGIVERAKCDRSWKSPHAAGREKNEGLQTKPKLLTLHGRLILECEVRIPFQIN